MTNKPILSAIRSILNFKDYATISEISKMTGQPPRHVLDVLNRNGSMVWRDRKTGRIIRVDPQAVLSAKMRESGDYYFRDTYGTWSVEGYCLKFTGHDELRQALCTDIDTGGIGDSWTEKHVMDTPENRAALEAAGLKLWGSDPLDDRLWTETAHD